MKIKWMFIDKSNVDISKTHKNGVKKNMHKALIKYSFFIFIAGMLLSVDVKAQPDRKFNTANLQIALQKFNVLGSVLYVAAHPDDENTAVLAYLSRGKKYRTAYLSVTRGDGGQNLIGPEKGAQIGIIRTQELLEARKIDGALQFFTRAIDFGYSKSRLETLEFWGKEKILSDLVWIIRKFQPDVILTRFSTTGSSGHGNHTASGSLIQEAFDASGNPNMFPEQLVYVEPWQAKRLFWNSGGFGRRGGRRGRGGANSGSVRVNIGEYNPLLGKSYTEISSESRSMHKSQGFGSSGRRGENFDSFSLVDGDPVNNNLFDSINTSWSRVPGGQRTGEIMNGVIASFDPSNPSESIPRLLDAYSELNKLDESHWVTIKRQELLQIIQASAGLWIEAIANNFSTTPGGSFQVRTTIVNRSNFPFTVEKISFPEISFESVENIPIGNNNPVSMSKTVRIPGDIPISQPYWLRETPTIGAFTVSDQRMIGLPENPPAITANITLRGGDNTLEYSIPVKYRWTDRVRGELYRNIEIRPEVTLNLENNIEIFSNDGAKEIKVTIKNNTSNVSGNVRLNGPSNWRISPASIPFSIAGRYGESQVTFNVTPPNSSGDATITAEAVVDGKSYDKAMVEIEYSHIGNQVLFPASSFKAVKINLEKRGSKIGYIMGSGDEIPEALRNVGYVVSLLDDEALESEDFSQFDAIVTGVRAYNTREILVQVKSRLMDYVNSGGTLVVQYNVTRGLLTRDIGPYPFTIGSERVSVEDAPVTFMNAAHQLLNFPNKITEEDFGGWIQERGLYFPSQWDERYDTVISSHDPGESDKHGSILFTKYGDGVFIYTGISWFRELPAGVPGAFRIFVNMISAGKYNGN